MAASTPLTSEELAEALKVELYDRTGQTETLGDLIKGKRSVLIFTRHFCIVFQLGYAAKD